LKPLMTLAVFSVKKALKMCMYCFIRSVYNCIYQLFLTGAGRCFTDIKLIEHLDTYILCIENSRRQEMIVYLIQSR